MSEIYSPRNLEKYLESRMLMIGMKEAQERGMVRWHALVTMKKAEERELNRVIYTFVPEKIYTKDEKYEFEKGTEHTLNVDKPYPCVTEDIDGRKAFISGFITDDDRLEMSVVHLLDSDEITEMQVGQMVIERCLNDCKAVAKVLIGSYFKKLKEGSFSDTNIFTEEFTPIYHDGFSEKFIIPNTDETPDDTDDDKEDEQPTLDAYTYTEHRKRIAEMLSAVYGNDYAKHVIAQQTYRLIKGRRAQPILFVGHTGSGKTLLYDCLEENRDKLPVKVTCKRITCEDLSPSGYRGDSIADKLVDVRRKMIEDDNPGGYLCLFIDELDKLTKRNKDDSTNQEYEAAPQFELMKFLNNKGDGLINNEKTLVLLAGVFEGVDDCEEKSARSIGFGSDFICHADKQNEWIGGKLLKNGMARELLGRITHIVKLEELGFDGMIPIADAKIEELREEWKDYGLNFTIDNETKAFLVGEAAKRGLGARGVNQVFEEVFSRALWKAATSDRCMVRITKEEVLKSEILFGMGREIQRRLDGRVK